MMKKFLNGPKILSVVLMLLPVASVLSVAGCSTTDIASAACAEGYERVRVGPRGQTPQYVCQRKSQNEGTS